MEERVSHSTINDATTRTQILLFMQSSKKNNQLCQSTTPGVEPGISRESDAEGPKSSALAIRPRGLIKFDEVLAGNRGHQHWDCVVLVCSHIQEELQNIGRCEELSLGATPIVTTNAKTKTAMAQTLA
ncbi:unnamed protein product [Fusarium graminearum]|uniref:Chromosome 2, complete genome n=1 Tax=Gibberella zeae (strain ATCC MYA-4620 / CBS 123657 / FGSC 9075 / NRRL 31084 / PH-1) TaxID=229533 RepID=A0A0E0S3J3_GIBZE|nr:hypothetical protein FG05_30093 [Fusarium graminearum]CEF78068.1 unnamed protein product [Fusarium graminearum]